MSYVLKNLIINGCYTHMFIRVQPLSNRKICPGKFLSL